MSIATRIQSIEEHISDAYDSLSKFGVAAPSNKNIENIASLVDEIYDNTPKTDYASGTSLTLEKTRVGKIDFKDTDTIEKIGLGATSQDDDPTPDSPVDVKVVTGDNTVTLYGKNLLKGIIETKTANNVTITKNNDNSCTITTNGTASANTFFWTNEDTLLKANTTYLIGLGNGNSNVQLSIRPSDNSTQYANTTTTPYVTYTPSQDINIRLFVRVANGKSINETIYPYIQEGTNTPSYEPYQSQSYEINLGTNELCQIGQYQDYIYKNNGNWYLHKEIGKMILNGNEAWTAYVTNQSGKYRNMINFNNITSNYLRPSSNANIALILCNCYTSVPAGTAGTYGGHQGISFDASTGLYIYDDIYNTNNISLFKTWLSTHNIIIYYVLATSTDTQITDTTLISQLDTWYNAQSMDDITHITVDGNLPMQLKLKALKK